MNDLVKRSACKRLIGARLVDKLLSYLSVTEERILNNHEPHTLLVYTRNLFEITENIYKYELIFDSLMHLLNCFTFETIPLNNLET